MDIVYTWVDGSDPAHQRERRRCAEQAAHADNHAASTAGDADAYRFRDNEDLRYALRSVERHAPWIDRVFLITNGQAPAWLDLNHPRLRIVTHTELFPDPAVLPTFNPCAIELQLHRIAGISDPFLYFNDDFLFARPARPEDFLTPAGGPRLYLTPCYIPAAEASELTTIYGVTVPYPAELRQSAGIWLETLQRNNALFDARYAPQPRRFPAHVGWLVRKDIFREMSARFRDVAAATETHRFRSATDLLPNHAYAQYVLEEGRFDHAVVDCFESTVSLALPYASLEAALESVTLAAPQFLCVQDDAGADPDKLALVRSFYQRWLPAASSFERAAQTRAVL